MTMSYQQLSQLCDSLDNELGDSYTENLQYTHTIEVLKSENIRVHRELSLVKIQLEQALKALEILAYCVIFGVITGVACAN